ncbi:MAG: CRISPR-associated protein Cas4 [Methanobacteriaceae archaeon]|nr:CRISPR-associated protein Cas4 [Methanobacteriaceae archaeon]
MKIIPVSSISEYVYCPMKLYLRYNVEETPRNPQMTSGKLYHQVRQEFQEMVKRDLWSITADMELKKVFNKIFNNLPPILEKNLLNHPDLEFLEKKDIEEIFKKIINQIRAESWIIAVKIKNIMDETEKDVPKIIEMLFPPAILEYKMEDREMGIGGIVDRIEVFDGVYYPVEIKSNRPPLKGVWESDELQIAAYGFLIEKEFNTEVLVGFIDYLKINERRPVVLNSKLRKKLLDTIEAIYDMFEGDIPEIDLNIKKCKFCEYSDYCEHFQDINY